VFENRVLRIFGPKRGKVTTDGRKVQKGFGGATRGKRDHLKILCVNGRILK
jgi:hypothetical protein